MTTWIGRAGAGKRATLDSDDFTSTHPISRRAHTFQPEQGAGRSGGAALVFAVSYTRLASCCTGGPRWALEIGLLALAFDPTSTLVD